MYASILWSKGKNLKKKILIFGASSGIGKEIVSLFSENYEVILAARRVEKLEEMKAEHPDSVLGVMNCDVTNLNDIEKVFEYILSNQIKLDGLVYSAGDYSLSMIKNTSMETHKYIMDVNYMGFVAICKKFLERGIAQKGASVVAVSSMASWGAPKALSSYATSKAALNTFVKVMAKETAKRGIRVNAILPGWVDTPMTTKSFQETGNDIKESIKKTQPMGLIPTIQIANMVEYLVSDKAKYITGALIPISGGDVG